MLKKDKMVSSDYWYKLIAKWFVASLCSVDQGMQVLVTDNSLARDLFPNDYNCLGDNENRPVKWMSVEALVNKCFSPASDVVGFGWGFFNLLILWAIHPLC